MERILCTIGIAVSYAASQLFQAAVIYFAEFGIPVMSLCIVFAMMILVSGSVPVLVYHYISKESVVERLRKGQNYCI